MALTTSDWIAIGATTIQVAVAIVIAIWQVRRSEKKERPPESAARPQRKFDWRYYFRESWQFFFAMVVGIWALWGLMASDEPVSKSFVIQVVAYSFLLVFGLVSAFVMLFVTSLRGALSDLRSFGKVAKQLADERPQA